MIHQRWIRLVLAMGAALALVTACGPEILTGGPALPWSSPPGQNVLSSDPRHPTPAMLGASTASRIGLEILQADTDMGYLVGKSSLVRGRIMTYEEARLILDGPNATRPKYSPERSVWLIVTRGQWLLHIPGAHGDPAHGAPPIPAHDILIENHYAGVILDATTGTVLERSGMNPEQEPMIQALPLLALEDS